LLELLGDKGYDGVGETLVMRCLSAVISRGIEPDTLVDEDPARLVSGMSVLKQAMFAAVDFVEKEFLIKNFIFVPFPIMIVPLVYVFSINLKPKAEQRKLLRQWFWNCCFTQRYKAGTNAYVLEDLHLMERIAANEDVSKIFSASVDASFFKKAWRINSTAAKAAICLLAQYRPRSFLAGSVVDLGTCLAAYNARQFHHIYPKAHLNSVGIQFHESNVIANVCLLTAEDNNKISDGDPKDYFQNIPSANYNEILESALIPEDFRDGSKPYAQFISARAELLAEAAVRLINDVRQ
jgi:hypothetical protein